MPGARLAAADGALAVRARELITAADALARTLATAAPQSVPGAEIAPAGARPPALADHALGDLLVVLTDQAARVAEAVAGSPAGAAREAAVRALADDCKRLRVEPPLPPAGFR
jgi:hypothetical protein